MNNTFSRAPGLVDRVFAVYAGSREFDFYRRHMSEQFFRSNRGVVGWCDGAMVLGKLPVPGRPTVLIKVGQGPIALAVGAGGGGLEIFTLIYLFFSFSLSLGDGPI